jgi:ubiquinone/menaquinone biosynthesis C-methylase UbiE
MSLDSYIAKQFNNPTGIGGKVVSAVMNRQNRPLYEETRRLMTLSDTDSILDIGCGSGYMLNMLARQYNCAFTGIDISASIIKEASQQCRKFIKSKKITLSCQNANKMSFTDNSFNKVYTVNTVYFWENLNNTMAEIRRVLKLNGLFVNALYSNETLSRLSHTQFGYKKFTLAQLTSAGNDMGFTVNIKPILNGAAYCVLYNA